jgi:uncharacterized membrane protein YraQ (UPF0718 family)
MIWKKEWKILILMIALFILCFYFPIELLQMSERFKNSLWEALYLVRWYAREHVLLCLIPAFFIAGAIAVFISQSSVMKYLGAKAKKVLAYGVASVSGTILAVCSCTVLPLFAGIYRMGAGLGPASTFLYSGPAINVLAIILTARVLGFELGIARALGAIIFSIIIGLLMHLIFYKEEMEKTKAQAEMPEPDIARPLWQNGLFFAVMVGILVFANWGRPSKSVGLWFNIFSAKWIITAILATVFSFILILLLKLQWWKVLVAAIAPVTLALLYAHEPMISFAAGAIGLSVITSTSKSEAGEWFDCSWGFAKQILPLLLIGILIAGVLLGRPNQEGLIPSSWIQKAVGGNSFFANLFASVAGAFMYFATLTEVPILQGLIGSGMGKGPALALLLSGPALSLPNMLVIRSVMGTKKTIVFVSLVVVMATISGLIYGAFFA